MQPRVEKNLVNSRKWNQAFGSWHVNGLQGALPAGVHALVKSTPRPPLTLGLAAWLHWLVGHQRTTEAWKALIWNTGGPWETACLVLPPANGNTTWRAKPDHPRVPTEFSFLLSLWLNTAAGVGPGKTRTALLTPWSPTPHNCEIKNNCLKSQILGGGLLPAKWMETKTEAQWTAETDTKCF